MADPFVGEIKINAYRFAPRGWSTCDGQILTINQNSALYSLLGTYYGGDGKANFALPDMRGRVPMGYGIGSTGSVYNVGNNGGQENVQLTISTMPQHNHTGYGVNIAATKPTPNSFMYAQPSSVQIYATPTALTPLHPSSVSSSGSGQGHNNMQPSLVLNFCIALTGYYPPRQ